MRLRRIRHLVRYLLRARHVLATEGSGALFRKVGRRVRSTPVRVRHRPKLSRLRKGCEPQPFAAVTTPIVSIIIPVHNKLSFTLRCLAALQQLDSRRTFEVIVVDDGSSDETGMRLGAWPGLRLVSNLVNRGFVLACNVGAAAARGKYLVFLNNDTEVQVGWLDALIDAFEVYPDAGLVGSRLLYPNGRLQEAGGIVFSDGSAWNYGHLDDPNKPEYSYLREPDYVSGASAAIRRDVFEELGGFDEAFAPGYYEDVDLAFRVRAAGHRVYYQPLSNVIHFEGISAGTDDCSGSGMKRFQAINRVKFSARWRHVLATHGERGEHLALQSERRIQRRALVADLYMLTPDKESGSLRMVNLCRILRELGFKITFAACNLEAPQPYLRNLQQQGIEVLYRPYVRSIERYLKVHGDDYDLVLLSRADTGAQLMSAARRYCCNARIVFDTVDLHFLREQRLATLAGKQAVEALAQWRKQQEIDLIAQADTTLVVSTVEQDLLARVAPDADVRVVSNIHNVYGSRRAFSDRCDMLFIGAFAHPPNTDGVLWFCHDIFPLVLRHEPDMKLFVIGANPPRQVRALASDNVRVLGHVRDVEPYFDSCRLSIAPLRYGAGVKGKINQSMAYGLPVVGTGAAVEGMYVVPGVSALVADRPRDFAREILRIYGDPDLWERLSRGGLAVMEAHFSFAAARRALSDLVKF
jgi:GT2 family glycosyltransferase